VASQKPGCLFGLLKLFGGGPERGEGLPYRIKDRFLTDAERSFYHVLRTAAGADLAICPMVRLADVLSITARKREFWSALNKISAKHVDFLLCDARTMKPVLAIELDDASHRRSDRASRDEFLDAACEAAGLPVLHVPVRRAYDPREIAAAIEQAVAGGPLQEEP